MARRSRKFGTSFSWKRASGLSSAKGRLSRQIGVPLTRSGRRQKVGRALGCLVPFGLVCIMAFAAITSSIVLAMG